jgi:ceramide glucosyltransferase
MAERSLLRLLQGALAAATAASVAYQVVSILAARRWRRRAPVSEVADGDLSVSVLKPVRGLEPHASESFASFCVQDHPRYELLFGVADADDPVVPAIRELIERHPRVPIRLVKTGTDLGPNRKVCNLHGLARVGRHELIVVCDSDMRVAPDYLRRVTAPFRDASVGLVTCPYRGAEPAGVSAALEALGIAAGFMPGVFVAALGRPGFAFGSTIALRRETLARIGGFEGLVQFLADDYQMGRRVADLGLRVHLSSVVVDSVLGRRPFRESWARRLRWARTVRACRPLGHLGSGLTHTTALALLYLLASGGEDFFSRESAKRSESAKGQRPKGTGRPEREPDQARSLFPFALSLLSRFRAKRKDRINVHALVGMALTMRLAAAWQVAVIELESEAARRWFPLLLVSDLNEAALWACSLFGRTVLWRGQRYRLLEGGRIERV